MSLDNSVVEEVEVWAECSDEEEFKSLGISHDDGTWSPKLEEVEGLYQQVKKNKFIDFEWKCSGRMEPLELQPEEMVLDSEDEEPDKGGSPLKQFDFEDMEDIAPSPSNSILSSKSRRSISKRTTTLAGILSNMERIRLVESLQRDPSPVKESAEDEIEKQKEGVVKIEEKEVNNDENAEESQEEDDDEIQIVYSSH